MDKPITDYANMDDLLADPEECRVDRLKDFIWHQWLYFPAREPTAEDGIERGACTKTLRSHVSEIGTKRNNKNSNFWPL